MSDAENKFAVIGAGSFGSAIACHLARIQPVVKVYSNYPKITDEINNHHTNSKYFGALELPNNIIATNDLREVATAANAIFVVVPSEGFTDLLSDLAACGLPPSTTIIIATKGIANDPVELLSDRVTRILPHNQFAFFYGPNIAQEIVRVQFTAASIAAKDLGFATTLAQELFMPLMEIGATDDIITPQIAAIVKNIVAINSGILSASGAGENAKAALIADALQEIWYIASKLGGKLETMLTPAVVGDLVLTSYSDLSRNSRFGFELHQNNYSKEFIASYPVLVEGAKAAKLLPLLLKKYNIELSHLPIIDSVVTFLCV